MHFNNYIFLLIAILIAGCNSYNNNHEDLAAFLKQVDSLPSEPVDKIEKLAPTQKKQYTETKKRSPFADPLNYTILDNDKNKITPNFNRKKSNLENFDLTTFVMLGSLSNNDEHWALVKINNESSVYSVTVGDYLGKNHGRITKIDDNAVHITEIIPLGKSWIERNGVINFKK
jgi:type IV pilus assembly protein PilP